jgi:hypothetical protein
MAPWEHHARELINRLLTAAGRSVQNKNSARLHTQRIVFISDSTLNPLKVKVFDGAETMSSAWRCDS